MDALGNCVTGIGGRWVAGATVSVILDVDNKQAYLQSESGGVSAETAALFGLGEEATVDEALKAFGLHWWRLTAKSIGWVPYTASTSSAPIIYSWSFDSLREIESYDYRVFYYSDQYTIGDDGKISLVNPSKFTADGELGMTEPTVLKNKYFFTDASTGLSYVYYTTNTKMTYGETQTGNKFYYTYKLSNVAQIKTVSVELRGEKTYVSSTDADAYPHSGSDGYFYYEYLGTPFGNAINGAKIETGSYIGTGAYGSANPNALAFAFEPRMVFIWCADSRYADNRPNIMALANGMPISLPMHQISSGFTNMAMTVSFSGETVSYYGSNAAAQMNESPRVYHYFAIA